MRARATRSPTRQGRVRSDFHASYIDDEAIDTASRTIIIITPPLTLLLNIVSASQQSAGVSSVDGFKREVDAAVGNLPRAF